MAQKFKLYDTNSPDEAKASKFSVLQGTNAPENADGSDGDMYIRHDPTSTSFIYKKVSGAWTDITAQAGGIGPAPDGSYADGLFDTWESTTTTGKAVDDLNEAVKYLAPPQGYTLNQIDGSPDFTISGATEYSTGHKITGQTSNPLTGVTYAGTDTSGGTRGNIINQTTFNLTTQDIDTGRGAVGFRNADQGILVGKVNDIAVGTLNLGALFIEGDRASGQTITGSHTNGQLQVTSIAPTTSFPLFQDGTARINVTVAQLRQGYNYITLEHTVDGNTTVSSQRVFWYSPTMTSPVASGLSMNAGAGGNPNVSSTTKNLSGVTYLSGGTYNAIAASVSNPYGNTYRDTGLILTSPSMSSVNVATPAPSITAGAVTNIPWNSTGNSMAISANKRVILSQTLDATATPKDNYNNNGTAANASLSNILIDSYAADAANSLTHTFVSENNRVASNANFDSLAVAANWDSSLSIANAGPAGYNDGLQCYNGALRYPTGNFSAVTAPSAGPDYSGATGARSYYGIFRDTSASRNNFKVTLNGITASQLGPVTDSSKIHVQMALPTQTTKANGDFEFKDCMVAYTSNNAIGCQNGTAPSGSNPVILFTAGTKGTANSDSKVVVKITYPQGSSAAVTSMVFSFTQP